MDVRLIRSNLKPASVVVASGTVGFAKPHPTIFRCAAAAVAVAISVALDGGSGKEVLQWSVRAAKMAETLRSSECVVTIASAIEHVHDSLSCLRELEADDLAHRYFPNKPETKVPLAISLAVVTKSVKETILLAANIGGDADSVASIGGAIAGALDPSTINEDWFDIVNSVKTS